MIALGDITKIHGDTAPIVDIITGGSPCQDLSIAGGRAGLSGSRSGLFMEQIRIIKEMRDCSERMGTADIRPRYMVWENVPGAFSSNKGEDFRAVLEETARIVDKTAVIPRPPKNKWTNSGCIMGDGWSIAWRVHDAQFWGVPQSRRRIALVADFGGKSAPQILFECESVCGDFEESGKSEQANAGYFKSDFGEAKPVISFLERAGKPGGGKGLLTQVDKVGTLSTSSKQYICVENHPANSRVKIREDGIVQALTSRMGTGGGNVPCIMECYCIGNGQADQTRLHKKACALNCMHDQQAVLCGNNIRRLTPLECERLQGYPDGWTDIGEWTDSKGKKHKNSDSPRYKALGNSIALPFWQWLAERICKQYERQPTMASLFDGIGGFPLVFTRTGAKPVWSSEIEEFPMAVTRLRFGGQDDKQEIQESI